MVHRSIQRMPSRNKNPTPVVRSLKDRGFTLVELLVVIAIISIIAGFLVPTLLRGRGEANKVACQNNLKELAKMAIIYSDSSGTRFFPMAPGGNPEAHESLNIMVSFFDELKPANFMCPEWRGGVAEKDDDGKFLLTAETCAYTWTTKKLAPTDAGYALSSDKYIKDKSADVLSGHQNGMNVVYTDTSVKFVLKAELDGELPKNITR